jgi:AcrR family transcriptional regulator
MTRQPAAARERLVEAAVQQLWANGVAATSPADIQQAAQVGQGSMYHHFAGKADLAFAAIERLASELAGELEGALAAGEPGLDRVLDYLERDRDPLRGCRVGRLTAEPDVVDRERLREPVAAIFTGLQARLAHELSVAQLDGQLDLDLDPAALAAALAAVVQGATCWRAPSRIRRHFVAPSWVRASSCSTSGGPGGPGCTR